MTNPTEAVIRAAGDAARVGYLPADLVEFFGEPIHVYTRAQAIADGALIDVTETAREAGFLSPVAMTAAAHADTVAWTRGSGMQDEAGRLWDVLTVARHSIAATVRGGHEEGRLQFRLLRIPNTGRGRTATYTELVIVIGGGDHAEPVLTIMRPSES